MIAISSKLTPKFEMAQAHYDLSDEFFRLFQDPTQTYSCAYFERELPSIDVADALLDERRGLTEWATTSGIFTISDLSKRGSVYAPLDESASVAGRPPQVAACRDVRGSADDQR